MVINSVEKDASSPERKLFRGLFASEGFFSEYKERCAVGNAAELNCFFSFQISSLASRNPALPQRAQMQEAA